MESEHNPDKATLQHLVLQLADILSCIYQVMQSAQLEVLLYQEYHHQHHHVLPPSLLPFAIGLLCSPPFWLSPRKLKGTKFSPVSAPNSEMGCCYLVFGYKKRLTQALAAGTRNKPIKSFYWTASFNGAVSIWDNLVLVTDK